MDKNQTQKLIKDAGGPTRFAEALRGITSQAVSQWKKIPAHHVLAAESILGVSRYKLRPDIYGKAPASEPAE